MIEQQGRVESVDGKHAWVRVGGRSGCAECDAGRGCGAGVFARLLKRDSLLVKVPIHPGLAAGSAVLLGIPEAAYLTLVMRIYGLPLLAALAGAFVGHQAAAVLGADPTLLDAATLSGGILAAILVFRFGTARGPGGLSFDIDLLEVKRECN